MTFIGGSYVVFPGGFEESTFIVRHLASGLFLHSEKIPDAGFLAHARTVLGGVLALSDEIARHAGLKRHIPPGGTRRQVIVPDAGKLSTLKHCVVFDADEFGTFLNTHGLPASCLDRLIINAGDTAIGSYEIGNSVLLTRPIVRLGNKLIVTMPSALLVAARHEILRAASERGVLNQVADRYSDAVWNTVLDSLDHLHNRPISTPTSTSPILGAKEAYFRLDGDKLLYAMLITDLLEDYNFDALSGDWRLTDLGRKVETRMDQVASEVMRKARNSMIALRHCLRPTEGLLSGVESKRLAHSRY